MKISFSATCFLLFFSVSVFAQNSNWDLKKDENGIKIYTRNVEGSGFKEFRAEMIVTTKISDIVTIFKNVAEYKEWVADVEKDKLLKLEGNDQYHYIETSIPWPLKNRDMVYHFRYLVKSDVETKIIVTGRPDYIPGNDGIIRMIKANGFWEFTSYGENRIKITYQLHVEPGGNIPAWFANLAVIDMPYITLLGLRNMLK